MVVEGRCRGVLGGSWLSCVDLSISGQVLRWFSVVKGCSKADLGGFSGGSRLFRVLLGRSRGLSSWFYMDLGGLGSF